MSPVNSCKQTISQAVCIVQHLHTFYCISGLRRFKVLEVLRGEPSFNHLFSDYVTVRSQTDTLPDQWIKNEKKKNEKKKKILCRSEDDL